MLGFYPYLVSSLSKLEFEKSPPYNFEEFLERCKMFLADKDYRILKELPLRWEDLREEDNLVFILKKWQGFNIALKNALVKLRAESKKVFAHTYLRETDYSYLELEKLVYFAFKNPSPYEAERIWDKIRWDFLEEEEKKHFFDFDYLVIYALKLLILLRWQEINRYSSEITLREIIS